MHLYNLHEVAKLKMLSYCGLCSTRVPKFSRQFLATDTHMTSKPIAALPMAKISASCMLQLQLLELFGWHLSGFGLQNSTNTLLLLTRKDIKEESHPSQSKFACTKRLWEHNARYFVGSALEKDDKLHGRCEPPWLCEGERNRSRQPRMLWGQTWLVRSNGPTEYKPKQQKSAATSQDFTGLKKTHTCWIDLRNQCNKNRGLEIRTFQGCS